MPLMPNVVVLRIFGQVVRGKALWRGKFKHKETMVVTRVDVSAAVRQLELHSCCTAFVRCQLLAY